MNDAVDVYNRRLRGGAAGEGGRYDGSERSDDVNDGMGEDGEGLLQRHVCLEDEFISEILNRGRRRAGEST
jgi:hypothetical protein